MSYTFDPVKDFSYAWTVPGNELDSILKEHKIPTFDVAVPALMQTPESKHISTTLTDECVVDSLYKELYDKFRHSLHAHANTGEWAPEKLYVINAEGKLMKLLALHNEISRKLIVFVTRVDLDFHYVLYTKAPVDRDLDYWREVIEQKTGLTYVDKSVGIVSYTHLHTTYVFPYVYSRDSENVFSHIAIAADLQVPAFISFNQICVGGSKTDWDRLGDLAADYGHNFIAFPLYNSCKDFGKNRRFFSEKEPEVTYDLAPLKDLLPIKELLPSVDFWVPECREEVAQNVATEGMTSIFTTGTAGLLPIVNFCPNNSLGASGWGYFDSVTYRRLHAPHSVTVWEPKNCIDVELKSLKGLRVLCVAAQMSTPDEIPIHYFVCSENLNWYHYEYSDNVERMSPREISKFKVRGVHDAAEIKGAPLNAVVLGNTAGIRMSNRDFEEWGACSVLKNTALRKGLKLNITGTGDAYLSMVNDMRTFWECVLGTPELQAYKTPRQFT